MELKIIRIEGSSMEPKYRSGDSVVAIWDDRLYIRGYFTDGERIFLRPRNPAAGEIKIGKDDPWLLVLGKVIARVPDVEMEGGFYS